MAQKSDFTEAEWTAVTEAPLLIMVTMFAAGGHGPIAMVKESAAGARLLQSPGDRGPAAALIAQIAPEAQSKESRHDVQHRKGQSIEQLITSGVTDLGVAARALDKIPADERAAVGAWFVDIARAVAAASKGTSEREAATIVEIADAFGVAHD